MTLSGGTLFTSTWIGAEYLLSAIAGAQNPTIVKVGGPGGGGVVGGVATFKLPAVVAGDTVIFVQVC